MIMIDISPCCAVDGRYYKRTEPAIPHSGLWKGCAQWIKDYWWGNHEPIEDEM